VAPFKCFALDVASTSCILGVNAKLRGDAVPINQATEPVGSLDSTCPAERPKGRARDWDLKVCAAVRSLILVMLDELLQYPIETSLTPGAGRPNHLVERTDELGVPDPGGGTAPRCFGLPV
jgi:hypothetical protein